MGKSSHWAFTVNNKTWKDTYGLEDDGVTLKPKLIDIQNDAVIYCQYSVEKGKIKGNVHIQGYIIYTGPRFMKQVKKDIGFPGAHLEKMISTVKANKEYCGDMKSDGTHLRGPWIYGDPEQVYENPNVKLPAYSDLIKLAHEGKTEKEIVEAHPFLIDHPRAIEKALSMFAPPPIFQRPVRVYLVWGPPHSGKTEACQAAFPDHFMVVGAYGPSSFLRYKCQKAIIFDAFKPNEWNITVMEQLIKPPVVDVNVKYGTIKTLWEVVIITSNVHPDSMYFGDVSRDSLFRRIYKTIRVDYDEFPPMEPKVLDFE